MKDPRKEKVKLGMHAGKHMGSAALGWGAAGEAEWGEVLRESKGFWFVLGFFFVYYKYSVVLKVTCCYNFCIN